MSTVEEILNAAQALPAADRAQLLSALWGTVSPEDWSPPANEWIAEAERRSAAYDTGEMTAASWSQVRQRVRGFRR